MSHTVTHLPLRRKEVATVQEIAPSTRRYNSPCFYLAGSDLPRLSKNAGVFSCSKEIQVKLSAAGEVVTTQEKRLHEEIPWRQEMPDRPFLAALRGLARPVL